MKTAISINDDIFKKAEETARQLGITRSKLFSTAVLEYVETHHSDAITEKLNQIYKNNDSKLDNDLNQANYDLFSKENW